MRLMDDFVSPLKGLQRPTDEAEKASLVGLEFLAGLLQHPAKNIRSYMGRNILRPYMIYVFYSGATWELAEIWIALL